MKEPFKSSDTRIDRILTVILIISIVLAISMTAYVIITPKEGEKFTELYLFRFLKLFFFDKIVVCGNYLSPE